MAESIKHEPNECQFCGSWGCLSAPVERVGFKDEDGTETSMRLCYVCVETDANLIAWHPEEYSPDVKAIARLISQATNLVLAQIEEAKREMQGDDI